MSSRSTSAVAAGATRRRRPFGIQQHADDIASIIEQLGGPVVVVGHSMGAFVAEMVAERRPDLVRDIVLVDGGTPAGRDPADGDIDAALDQMLGPGIERIRTVWPDRVSYHAMWASHPAFVDGISPDLERNLLADLIEVDGGFRTAVDEAAVRADGHDLLADPRCARSSIGARPTTIVRAEFGMLGDPPPFITDDVRASVSAAPMDRGARTQSLHRASTAPPARHWWHSRSATS